MKTGLSRSQLHGHRYRTLVCIGLLGLTAGWFFPSTSLHADDSAAAVLKALGDDNPAVTQAQDVSVKITLAAPAAHPGDPLHLKLAFAVAPGWHIYGAPLPPEYTPTRVIFDGDLVQSQSLQFPKPEMLKFPALSQTFPVYHGNFTVPGSLVLRPALTPGDYQLAGKIEFQECNDSLCKPPQSIPFAIPLKIAPPV